MSYKIRYASNRQIPVIKKKHHLQVPVAAVLLVAAMAVLRCVYPEETQRLTDALVPWSRESTIEALEVFADDIREGESFGEAAAAFCMEIINEADLPQ